ncbi:F-actin-monooxygenase MICAL2 isoform X3 [Ambystoma mexicanum]|uniref:F-actin-monooxygenase MICAL2 isoform X3 n=1 Tax=Ambystoma mexicanum TaxID=8296 RepID=UPI0037E7C61A
MGENDVGNHSQAGQLFENFVQASTCKGTLQAFNILTRQLELDPLDYRNFYTKLKAKVSTWKAKALWNKLDKKTSHKEYKKGRSAINTKCLVIGGGPCGLRSAIELASLGAKVVVVEKRDTFSRNNVLHLWPFTIHDLRGLGAKKFYGKFCAGSIDHISIRQLQLILFKVALLLGVEIHVNLEFVKVLEPAEDQECKKVGWRAEYLPIDHPLSEYEFDVIIGADGRRNTLEGFRRKEFRGKLAIAITANFINRNTTAEAKVEEISGVAFIFNQKFFQDLKEETGIDLENIVYYKDSTHYFVMTAKKQSLLDKGVIINDYIDTEMLLSLENVNQENLLSYAREAADFATNYQLPTLDYAINHYGQPDVAMFDFTSMHASENAALIRERHGHHLLVALVGDSLLEPFWPMGTGCARGFFAVFDTVWMVKGWAQAATPLELLAERESLYRLLPQTTPENISKNFDQYTIDPGTRYPNLNSSCVRPNQVRHLYLTNELQHYPVERASSIRRSVKLSRHESDVRPNKLLTWCQKQTEGYKNVNVIDLATSWKSGLALCAIIHHFRPELIDFDSLNEEDAIRNNQLAFDVAEKEFGIPPITTGKEMASTSEPDKLSMVMYLSKFYELFRGTPLRVVDNAIRENGTTYPLKTSNGIYNNHINLTLPRKRVPKLERKAEENDSSKRRRKGAGGDEPASFSSHSASSGSEYGDSKEGTSQNKVKSMATQLLAKFEDNAPNGSLRRQGSLRKEFPTNIGGSDICYFCKKRVYVMERLSAEGHFFHRECFKCNFCSATLRLAAYAFDVDEGKFYCKPHFIYCKTNNKQRKRRVELNAQMQEEAPMWKKEEPAMAETVRAGAFTTVSGAEDSSPDIIYQSSDEATSPKKFRNVPEFHKSRSSSVSSEWASVKIIPEEEMAEHNLLAVRVMVTSDGSSSEIESDVCGNNSKSEFSEHWYTATEPELRRSPLKRIISLDHCNTKQEDASRPSKAAAALHRASSFQASPSNDQQNWRKMIRSSFTFIGKKPELPSNEPSLNSPKSPDRDLPTLKVCSSEMTTETLIPRFPILQGKSIELQREIPSYVPHSQQLPHCTQDEVHKVNRGFQTHGIQGPVLDSKDDNARTKLHPSEKVPKSGQEPPPVKPPLIERNIAGYSRVKEDNDSTIIRKHGAGVGHDLSENLYLKKLVLSKEEKADLLDWNHRNTQRPSLEFKRHPTMDISDPAPYTSNPHRTEGKLPHLSVPRSPPRTQGSTLASLVDRKDVQDIPKAEAEPAAAAQSGLGSPFRIIASVFKRSLNSSPESNKNTSNQKPQPLSSSNILKFSSAAGQSGGLRRSQSHVEHVRRPFISGKPSESSLHKTTTSGEADINTLNTTCSPSNLSTGTVGTFSNPIFEKYPDNKMDAPMLKRLERVTIKDISPKDPTDDIFLRNRKNSFFSSLRFRDKPSEIITDRPKAKSDLWNIIGTIRKKVNEREMNDPEKRTATPFSAFFTENVLNNPFAKQETGSKHLPARSSFNGDYSSSSDDEWDTKPPSSLKARRTSKRRKKLEREAKQKIKQEELKRLHKAQSIQRQLQEIEERQHALEIQGVKLEKAIREKSDSGAQDDGQLLQEWFKLVMEKNTLIRYESELLIIAQGLELEDHQSRLEQKLREKMSIDDSQKDEKDKKEEQVLLCEKMRVIEQRDKLVSFLEQQRLLEKAEDSSLENIMSSQGYQFNVDRKQGYEDAKLPTTCWNLH